MEDAIIHILREHVTGVFALGIRTANQIHLFPLDHVLVSTDSRTLPAQSSGITSLIKRKRFKVKIVKRSSNDSLTIPIKHRPSTVRVVQYTQTDTVEKNNFTIRRV